MSSYCQCQVSRLVWLDLTSGCNENIPNMCLKSIIALAYLVTLFIHLVSCTHLTQLFKQFQTYWLDNCLWFVTRWQHYSAALYSSFSRTFSPQPDSMVLVKLHLRNSCHLVHKMGCNRLHYRITLECACVRPFTLIRICCENQFSHVKCSLQELEAREKVTDMLLNRVVKHCVNVFSEAVCSQTRGNHQSFQLEMEYAILKRVPGQISGPQRV